VSVDLSRLTRPVFVTNDAQARVAELVARYEAATGKTVYPAQPERLLIDNIAYADANLRAAIQYAGEQNLLAYAEGAALEHLAAFFGVTRLDGEEDEHLRERVRLAPESFSVAGSRGAYRYWAMTADPSISDVAVVSPDPGVVRIYPLTVTGLPSQSILDAVDAICSPETVRPLCDTVEVATPEEVTYTITAVIEPYLGYDGELARQEAQAAAQAWADRTAALLGRDLVRSQIIAALSVAGVYRVSLSAPAVDRVLDVYEWARCTAVTVIMGDMANG
jgi:phage-related baseplate assembly protein